MPGCLERRTTSRGFVLAGAYFAMIMFAGGAPSDEIKECIYRSGTWTLINRPVGCAVTYCARTKRSSNPWLNWYWCEPVSSRHLHCTLTNAPHVAARTAPTRT
jgi:hypothetical protein